MAEEEALVRVEEVDEVPVEVRTAPHLGQQARLTRHHSLQLNSKYNYLCTYDLYGSVRNVF